MNYDIKDIPAPRLTGSLLRTFARMLESSVAGPGLVEQLFKNMGVRELRRLDAGNSTTPYTAPHKGAFPRDADGDVSLKELLGELPHKPLPGSPTLETAADFVSAYQSGRTTPEQVARRIIECIRTSDQLEPPLRSMIAQSSPDLLEQAKRSALRYQQGAPLGPLDGVPVAIKDEFDLTPYSTNGGTSFIGGNPARQDAEVVARLRKAGALLIGKANMQEIGIGVMGYNPHYGTPRNPYDPERLPGGSSGGSAVAVAAGLCPIAVGADGGGSIRIPASFCGQVGLKPTFGRVSEYGALPLCWSVTNAGPIAATLRDAALAYLIMSGEDPKDHETLGQPSPHLEGVFQPDVASPLAGLKLGVYRPWFEHCDEEVLSTCTSMLEKLEKAGAEVREVEIPELGLLRLVHLITIVSEMVTSQLPYYARHRTDYGGETRVNLALGRNLRASDYVHAQRHRSRLGEYFERVLTQVDVIVTPATACTAPPVHANALDYGESNLKLMGKIMRYAVAANLTGMPALSFPVGYDSQGLPVGMQVMGRRWEEHLLLRIGAVAEGLVERRRPRVHYRLLKES